MPERERTPFGTERTVLRDPELGVLHFHADLGWWAGDFPGGEDAALYVDGTEEVAPQWRQQVRATVRAVRGMIAEAKEFAALHLLDLHNERWNEGDTPLGHDAFVAAITLSSVALRGNGTVSVYFDDGDLFDGQPVLVSLDRDLVPSDASLASE